jgi:hypothetical protein
MKEIELEQRELYDGNISMCIPMNFVLMDEELAQFKYPLKLRPEYIYTNKNLFKDISYLSGKNGARVFIELLTEKIEILAKSSKANEQKVIDILTKMYN